MAFLKREIVDRRLSPGMLTVPLLLLFLNLRDLQPQAPLGIVESKPYHNAKKDNM
jgi:hypothetical protein